MKVQLESTTKVVELVINGARVPARIWEGETESGIPVHAYILRIAAPKEGADLSQFEAELMEQKTPTVPIQDLPARLIL